MFKTVCYIIRTISDQDEIPSILQLILDIVTISFNDVHNTKPEVALKTLTIILSGVYSHNIEKTILYLHRCRPVIEFIITSRIKGLFKEVWFCNTKRIFYIYSILYIYIYNL